MIIHRVILRNEKGELIKEIRYSEGILYTQNRSYDIEISFDDFIDRLKTTKKQINKTGFTLIYDVVKKETLWTMQ